MSFVELGVHVAVTTPTSLVVQYLLSINFYTLNSKG
jgi:hypothetical protein